MKRVILAVLIFAFRAHGQVIAVGGGLSPNLYGSSGANATLYTTGSTSSFDLGYSLGHVRYGAGTYFRFRKYEIALGDTQIAASQNGGIAFAARGVAVKRKWDGPHHTMLQAFVGGASPIFSSPYFVGYSGLNGFTTGVLFTRDITKHLHFESLDFVRYNLKTAAQSVTYTRARFGLTGSGGLLSNVKTLNAGVNFQPSRHIGLYGNHSDLFFYDPSSPNTPIHSTLNSAGAQFNYGLVSSHASYFESKTGGVDQGGVGFGGGIHFRPLLVGVDYFQPRKGSPLLVETFTEKINRRISIQQFVSNTMGQTSINGGGSYTNNEFTASIGYSVLYYPTANPATSPFRRVFTLSLSFHAPHSSTVNISSVALPNGKIQYAVGGSSWFQGPMAEATNAGSTQHEGSAGGERYYGRVVDENGIPVEGAAVLVGKDEVFTDGEGRFVVRSKSKSAKTLRILTEDFTTPIDYVPVSAPATVSPDADATIVVKRK